MMEVYKQVLGRANIGIIVLDDQLKIKFWNQYIQRISGYTFREVLDTGISDLYPNFAKKPLQNILKNALEKGQCRFCSSKLHKAFIYPKGMYSDADIHQNMSVEPIYTANGVDILIQVEDITVRVKNELKLTSLISELQKGYTEVKELEEFNRQIAFTDTLTGLLSRHAITQSIDDLIARNDEMSSCALLFLDLDGFKKVNDVYGHQTGDALLVKFARSLILNTRSEDLVARLGGDEFLILLKGIRDIRNAQSVAEKLIRSFSNPIIIKQDAFCVTASIGVAVFTPDVKTTAAIIKRADIAMYQAKKNGKNTFAVYMPEQSKTN